MRLRPAAALAVTFALILPSFAFAKVLTEVRSQTKSTPTISASGFLEFPKQFRVTITSNKGGMKVAGSFAAVNCSHGEHSKTKYTPFKGSPRINKRIKPSMKHSQACFVSLSIVGDRPGTLKVKLTGTKRKGEASSAASAAAE
jgi:hypothetical protein